MNNSPSDAPIALVTGGASGIGRASSIAFAATGAHVAIADVDALGAAQTQRMIEDAGGAASFMQCSVSEPQEVKALFGFIRSEFGRLDFAHNNAGVEQPRASIIDCPVDDWDRTIGINLKGVWLSMKYELALMVEAQRGAIVNTSSMVGSIGAKGAAAYVASKHGILGLTKAAALEVASEGVRVNAVCPGHILTPMVQRVIDKEPAKRSQYQENTPMGRLGTPEEVASAVVWLCSEGASFITGTGLGIDGGVLLS